MDTPSLLEDDENMNSTEPDAVENLLIEYPRTESVDDTSNTDLEKIKSSDIVEGTAIETKLEPLDVSEKVDPVPGTSESMTVVGLSSQAPPGAPASEPTLPPQTVDNKTKVYLKPPMSPELMIAIAVRNLDPNKEVHSKFEDANKQLFLSNIYQVGASCSDIVAFLSLHFPYFTENYEECKDMVRF